MSQSPNFNIYLTSKWGVAADGLWSTQDGEVLYRTIDPWTSSTVTLERAFPSHTHPQGKDTIQYTPLATLRFRDFHSNVLKFDGKEYKEDDYFKKGPKLPPMKDFFNWGRDRIFTGPDGVEYAWKLRKHAVVLFRKEDTKTENPIAIFHPKKSSYMGMRQGEPAYLEIMPAGQFMVDLVFITFIYAEKLRYSRELSSSAGKLGVDAAGAFT